MLTIREFLDLPPAAARDLLDDFSTRISQENFNAVLTATTDQARADFDQQFARPARATPILLKDNILTRGTHTTAAAKILQNFTPSYDATIVERLRDAGFSILWKTNLDEFAMGSSNETSAFGPVRNPRNPELVPGWSSGGSAAAIPGNLALGAIGTDTGGSVRQPAAFCGCVGVKPSYGRISRFGVIAMASSLDQVGVFSRSVHDARFLLKNLVGHDPRDATSEPDAGERFERTDLPQISNPKILVPTISFCDDVDPRIRSHFSETLKKLESTGRKIEQREIPGLDLVVPTYLALMSAEASSNLARFDGIRFGHSIDSFDAQSGRDFLQRSRAVFGHETTKRILLGNHVLSSANFAGVYQKAKNIQNFLTQERSQIFSEFDAVLSPTSPSLPRAIGTKLSPAQAYLADLFTIPANLAGLPALSLPAGQIDGLPVGLHLMTAKNSEKNLFALAATAEQIFPPILPEILTQK